MMPERKLGKDEGEREFKKERSEDTRMLGRVSSWVLLLCCVLAGWPAACNAAVTVADSSMTARYQTAKVRSKFPIT